jgi:hypothetical protein
MKWRRIGHLIRFSTINDEGILPRLERWWFSRTKTRMKKTTAKVIARHEKVRADNVREGVD